MEITGPSGRRIGEPVLTGAVVMLRSTVRMGRQLQNLSQQDLGAFSQIVAVSPKMRQVMEQAEAATLTHGTATDYR
jgi:transcriptional regulator of aroF, aroG, tyrA and aromatic amino acid transport